jgi:hypothetical protein
MKIDLPPIDIDAEVLSRAVTERMVGRDSPLRSLAEYLGRYYTDHLTPQIRATIATLPADPGFQAEIQAAFRVGFLRGVEEEGAKAGRKAVKTRTAENPLFHQENR